LESQVAAADFTKQKRIQGKLGTIKISLYFVSSFYTTISLPPKFNTCIYMGNF